MNISSKDVVWQNGEYFDGQIKNGMKLGDVVKVIEAHAAKLYKVTDLSCIDIQEYGITCPPTDEVSMLCFILKMTLDGQVTINNKMQAITKFYKEVVKAATTMTDEKAKVSATSTSAKFLYEAFSFTPGRAKVENDTIKVSGLVPIGARMTISKRRLSDFDVNGKGKPGTDLEGWAIRDGRNGLDNALGVVLAYTDTLDNADKKSGSNTTFLALSNVPSMTLSVAGVINESLTTPVTPKVKVFIEGRRFGLGERYQTYLDRAGMAPNKTIEGNPLNLAHSHTFNLSANYTNPSLQPISILPANIKEVPIEFIGI